MRSRINLGTPQMLQDESTEPQIESNPIPEKAPILKTNDDFKKEMVQEIEKKPKKNFEDLRPSEIIPITRNGQFGNSFNYCKKRMIYLDTIDSRILQIGKIHFEGKRVLDIGCYMGVLSLQIAKYFEADSVKGIDIDYRLINKAVKNWAAEEHRVKIDVPALTKTLIKKNTEGTNLKKDLPSKKAPEHLEKQFDIEFLGKRPTSEGQEELVNEKPTKNNPSQKQYPFNVSFEVSNILQYKRDPNTAEVKDEEEIKYETLYDTVLCFSVLKYVHLNFGDAGLRRTFTQLAKLTKPGGILILEYQAWKSYNKKKGFCSRFKSVISTIKIKPKHFKQVLEEDYGFEFVEEMKSIREDSFKRPLFIFRKKIEEGDQ